MTAALSRWHPKELKKTFIDTPLYIITHPFKGFDEIKTEGIGEIRYAIIILIMYGLVRIFQFTYTGFIITGFWMETTSISFFWVMFMSYTPIALICISNWSVTSITNGSGRLKEIFLVYCYALFPNVICRIIGTVISNYVTTNEAAFVTFFFTFGNILLYFLLFIGLIVIHEYTFFKSVLMVILTVLSALIITFILALFFSLVGNVIEFIYTIVMELEAHVF